MGSSEARESLALYAIMLVIAVVANQWMLEYDVPLLPRISACFIVGMCVAIVYRWFERRARRRNVR